MIHLAFGLVWLTLSATLLYWRETIAARGSDPSMLAAFAIVLACYNFLRCAVTWVRRRQDALDEEGPDVPSCPRCGRHMKLVDLGPNLPAEKDRYKLVCCGYQLQIEDDDERRHIIKKLSS